MGSFTYNLRRIKNHYSAHGSHPGLDIISLEQDCVKFGRNPEQVDIVLHSTAYANMISREHAEIRRSKLPDGTIVYHLYDKSLNGTYVNDFRVAGQSLLQHGDVIQFGHVNGAAIHPGESAPQPDAEFTYMFEKAPRHPFGARMASFFANSARLPGASGPSGQWPNPYALAASGAQSYLAAAAASFNPYFQSVAPLLSAGQNAAARQSPFTPTSYGSSFQSSSGDHHHFGASSARQTDSTAAGMMSGHHPHSWLGAAAAQQSVMGVFGNAAAAAAAPYAAAAAAAAHQQQQKARSLPQQQQQQQQLTQSTTLQASKGQSRDPRLSSVRSAATGFGEQQLQQAAARYQEEQKTLLSPTAQSTSYRPLPDPRLESEMRYSQPSASTSSKAQIGQPAANTPSALQSFYDQSNNMGEAGFRNVASTSQRQAAPVVSEESFTPQPPKTTSSTFTQSYTTKFSAREQTVDDSNNSNQVPQRNSVLIEPPVKTQADTSFNVGVARPAQDPAKPELNFQVSKPTVAKESSDVPVLRSPDTTVHASAFSAKPSSSTDNEDERLPHVRPPTVTTEQSKSLSNVECDSSVPSPPLITNQTTNDRREEVDDDSQALNRDIFNFASSVQSRCLKNKNSPESDSMLEVSVTSVKELDDQCPTKSVMSLERGGNGSSPSLSPDDSSSKSSFTEEKMLAADNELDEDRPPPKSSTRSTKKSSSTTTLKQAAGGVATKKRKTNEVARLLSELSDSSFMFEMRNKEAQQLKQKTESKSKTEKGKLPKKGPPARQRHRKGSSSSADGTSSECSDSDDKQEDESKSGESSSEADSDNKVLSHLHVDRRRRRRISPVAGGRRPQTRLSGVSKQPPAAPVSSAVKKPIKRPKRGTSKEVESDLASDDKASPQRRRTAAVQSPIKKKHNSSSESSVPSHHSASDSESDDNRPANKRVTRSNVSLKSPAQQTAAAKSDVVTSAKGSSSPVSKKPQKITAAAAVKKKPAAAVVTPVVAGGKSGGAAKIRTTPRSAPVVPTLTRRKARTTMRPDKRRASLRSSSSSVKVKAPPAASPRVRKQPVKTADAFLRRDHDADNDGGRHVPSTISQHDLFWSFHDPSVACASGDSCLMPVDPEVQWVQCDQCSGWYHVECVGCDFEAFKNTDAEYYCEKCKS